MSLHKTSCRCCHDCEGIVNTVILHVLTTKQVDHNGPMRPASFDGGELASYNNEQEFNTFIRTCSFSWFHLVEHLVTELRDLSDTHNLDRPLVEDGSKKVGRNH